MCRALYFSVLRPGAGLAAVRVLSTVLTVAAPVLMASTAHAGNVLELGAGWQNLGAVRDVLQWQPSVQGSRKDVPAFVGWRYMGQGRVFWAPSVRLNFTNFWSIGGAGNLLGVTLAPAAVGVYLTRQPATWSPEARRGRWAVAATLGTSVQLGGNVTPDQPRNASVPDPDAHRAALRAQLQQGGTLDVLALPQRYPLGSYAFAALGVPLRIDAWGMATQRVGVGFFIEAHPLILEWQISQGGSATPAYGYNVTAGLATHVF